MIALCGWDVKVLPPSQSGPLHRWNSEGGSSDTDRTILSCKICGAKTGLWTYMRQSALMTSGSPLSFLSVFEELSEYHLLKQYNYDLR